MKSPFAIEHYCCISSLLLCCILTIDIALYTEAATPVYFPRRMHMSTTMKTLQLSLTSSPSAAAELQISKYNSVDSILRVRGGSGSSSSSIAADGDNTATKTTTTKKRKKKKKRSTKTNLTQSSTQEEDKKAISDAMKENSNVGEYLSGAIRKRKDILREEMKMSSERNQQEQSGEEFNEIDASLISLGVSMGTSSYSYPHSKSERQNTDNNTNKIDGGGVEASKTSILANYFLQSHGGAYVFQCIASLLSVLFGLSSFLIPLSPSALSLKTTLLKKCLLFALTKHFSGLVAASFLSAKQIPQIGLFRTRKKIHAMARDPVAQYLFYCALLLFWISSSVVDGTSLEVLVHKSNNKYNKLLHLNMLGPILIREIIHLSWVLWDVVTILGLPSDDDEESSALLQVLTPFIKVMGTSVDAFMSLLFTPDVWRGTSTSTTSGKQQEQGMMIKRQRLMAKLVSRISLLMEIFCGIAIIFDALMKTIHFTILNPRDDKRPNIMTLFKSVLCARLYFNFLVVRQRKIVDLVTTIRGGAVTYSIHRVLDVLLEPKKTMGLLEIVPDDNNENKRNKEVTNNNNKQLEKDEKGQEWLSLFSNALGI